MAPDTSGSPARHPSDELPPGDGDGAEPPSTYNPIARQPTCFLANPWTQVTLMGIICFCCPGMFNVISAVGAAGKSEHFQAVASKAAFTVSGSLSVSAFFIASPLFSLVGPRTCVLVGGWTYAMFAGSLLYLARHDSFDDEIGMGLVITCAALLGLGAGCLWIVQGAILTTYVPESQKGRAIALSVVLYQLGGALGSLAIFGMHFNHTDVRRAEMEEAGNELDEFGLSNNTYIAIMCVMAIGWMLALFILSPSRMRQAQHRPAKKEDHSLRSTVKLAAHLLTRWRVIAMLPLFFVAASFYPYQLEQINGGVFNIRTSSLNSALFSLAHMAAGLLTGVLLDLPFLRRPARARLGWGLLFFSSVVVWGGALAFQLDHDRRYRTDDAAEDDHAKLDITDGSEVAGPITLFIVHGAFNTMWQNYCYWIIGAESNSTQIASILVGVYETLQAAGGTMAWVFNAHGKQGMAQVIINWVLSMVALLIVIPAAWTVTDHTEVEEMPCPSADMLAMNR